MSSSIRASASRHVARPSDPEVPGPTPPAYSRSWRDFRRNPLAKFGAVTIVTLLCVAVFAPWLAPRDPDALDYFHGLAPPGRTAWLGTDSLGRDTLSRLVFSTRVSLIVGLGVFLAPGLPVWSQWALFGVLAIVSLVFFRRWLRDRFPGQGAKAPRNGPTSLECPVTMSPAIATRSGLRSINDTTMSDSVCGLRNMPVWMSEISRTRSGSRFRGQPPGETVALAKRAAPFASLGSRSPGLRPPPCAPCSTRSRKPRCSCGTTIGRTPRA